MEIRLVIDDRIVSGLNRVRRLLGQKRVALVVGGGLLCSSALVSADTITKAYTFAAGTPIVAAQINENFDQLFDAVNERVIRESLTIPVADCEALKTALDALGEKSILPSATVTLQVAAGTHTCSGAIAPAIANGRMLVITGATTDAADTVLSFASSATSAIGFDLMMSDLRELSNLSLVGPAGSTGSGIFAHAGARLTAINVAVSNFAYGLRVENDSYAAVTGMTVTGSTSSAFQAQGSASIYARGGAASISGGTCFRAASSGYITVDDNASVKATCTGTGVAAVQAYLTGTIQLVGLDISGTYSGSVLDSGLNSAINAAEGSIAPSTTYSTTNNGALKARYQASIRYSAANFTVSAEDVAAVYAPAAEGALVYAN